MNKDILLKILLICVIYSLIFAYIARGYVNYKYFFLICSILQLLGAFCIYLNDLEISEIIHFVMFLLCILIILFIPYPIINIYVVIITFIILFTRLWFKGCLFYEKNDGNDGLYLSYETSIYVIGIAIIILLCKILYLCNRM